MDSESTDSSFSAFCCERGENVPAEGDDEFKGVFVCLFVSFCFSLFSFLHHFKHLVLGMFPKLCNYDITIFLEMKVRENKFVKVYASMSSSRKL